MATDKELARELMDEFDEHDQRAQELMDELDREVAIMNAKKSLARLLIENGGGSE